MSNRTSIEWAERTWQVTLGCVKAGASCKNCYAVRQACRIARMGPARRKAGISAHRCEQYAHVVDLKNSEWNGWTVLLPEALEEPAKIRKPSRFFVNSMGDLFYGVPAEFLNQVLSVMAATPQHQYIVLTKRPAHAAEYLQDRDPLLNLRVGSSAGTQAELDERLPLILKLGGSGWRTLLSCEPLLEPLDLHFTWKASTRNIGVLVAGGESGPRARPCDIAWLRSLRDQCQAAGVPFFLKQLGANIQIRNDRQNEWPRDGDELIDLEPEPEGQIFQGDTKLVRLAHPKGGDPAEWPADLQACRNWPNG